MNKIVALIFFLIFPIFILHAESKANYTAEDVLSFQRIGQVIASPNGKQVAFTVIQAVSASAGKKWQSSLYLKNSQGKIILLTPADQHAASPLWSSNGKSIAYIAKGEKFQSIWTIDILTLKSTKLFEFVNDIGVFRWSPDGKYIAFVADDEKKKESSELKPTDKAYDYINTRIYLIPADTTIKTAKPLTSPRYSISQNFPNSLIDTGFDWAPDSQSITFAYQPRPEATYSNEAKIAVLNLKNLEATTIPFTNNFTGQQPSYSPDGKWIAFRSNSRDENSLTNNPVVYAQICVSNTSNLSNTYCLSNTFNEAPVLLGWNKTNNSIFVLDWYKTTGMQLYSLDLDPKKSAQLISSLNGFLNPLSLSLNQDHSVFGFGYETTNKPPEAFVSPTDHFKLEKISNLNSTSHQPVGNGEIISWKSSDGAEIEGLLITPKNYNPHNKYPLLVTVHGGPAGVWEKRYLGGCEEYGEAFVPDCYANLTSLGFIIFQPNPRGSTGYGKKFRVANVADLGGGDYHDIMSGVDYLILKGIADPNHLAIFGWSYGGYMTAWTISQTNNFKVAIEGDGLTDLISFYGTSDVPWFLTQYLGATLWGNTNLYLQRSPLTYVKNIKTPLLILHGQKDVRVPLTQANELYTALQLQNKSVKLLVSPDTGHVPDNANIIYENILEVDEWLKKAL